MTAYNFEGNIVDLKATNLHMSARPDGTLNVAGATGFGTLPYTCIPAGAILTEGATAGTVDVSVGADDAIVLGVAIDARLPGDARPLTYTYQGYVRLVAGTGGVTKGDFIKPDSQAGYYGCAVTWADVTDTDAHTLTAQKKKIGKALTTAAAGATFEAYLDCMGV